MNTVRGQGSPPDADGEEIVMTMLEQHVPLALVVDLTEPSGPESAEILAEEGEPQDRWWES